MGTVIFKEAVALSTKVGVTIIIVGGLVISWSEVVLLLHRLLDLFRRTT